MHIEDKAEVSTLIHTYVTGIYVDLLISNARKRTQNKQDVGDMYKLQPWVMTSRQPTAPETRARACLILPSMPTIPGYSSSLITMNKRARKHHFLFSHFHKDRCCLLRLRHALHLFTQRPPIIRLQLRILDTFLRPLLVQSTNMVLRLLEEEQFVADAFLDEDAAGVLLDDRFLVLVSRVRRPSHCTW